MADVKRELSAAAWNKDVVKAMFDRRASGNIDRYFELIDAAIDAQLGARPATVAPGHAGDAMRQIERERLQLKLYAFATIAVENSRMACNDEGISKFNTHGIADHIYVYRPFGIYDFDSSTKHGRHIGNHGVGLGEMYRGRGFFQLTGMANYTNFGNSIGMPDLVMNPDKAGTPSVAAALVAAYLLHHKTRILRALDERDFKKARQVVNGSRALHWDELKSRYETGEAMINRTIAPPAPIPGTTPPPSPTATPAVRLRQT